jgi:4-amino-4-deoxy-L-arabinose transferase-like glycosyltransferase
VNLDLSSRRVSARTRFLWITAIFGLALALRIVATHLFEGLGAGPNAGAFYDGVEFEKIAFNLVTHGEYSVTSGHPTSFRAPGFPLALSVIYQVFGAGNYLAAHVFFCVIGAALTLAGYLLGREVLGDVGGLATAALIAVYPNLLYYAMHFASEPLFTLLLTLSVWLFIVAMRRWSPWLFLLSGVLLGLSALTRPVSLYFLPFFALVALWAAGRRWRTSVAGIAYMAVGLALPIIPWAVRNYRVHDRYVLLASNGGSTFWGSNNAIVLSEPKYHGDWITTESMPDQKRAVHALPNEIDRDKLEWEYGKAFVREHLADVPRLLWYKLDALWTPVSRTPNRAFNLLHLASYGLALPFILGGVVLVIRRRGLGDTAVLALLAPVAATTAATLVFYGSARFRSTIEPILLVFAAAAVCWVVDVSWRRISASGRPR